jgi:hypothetical protein
MTNRREAGFDGRSMTEGAHVNPNSSAHRLGSGPENASPTHVQLTRSVDFRTCVIVNPEPVE